MTITANWSADSVRRVCIVNNFCTSMTCHEYERLLNFVSCHEPTAFVVDTVAHMIEQGSDTPEDLTRAEFLEHIAYALLNSACYYRLEA